MASTETVTEPGTARKTVGSKVTADEHNRLRWLAYQRRDGASTVSAIIAGYIARCLADEDFTGYVPPAQQGE